jgi:hypothetical protein
VFRRHGSHQAFRIGVAIGDQILDLPAAHAIHAFAGYTELQGGHFTAAVNAPHLNALMALGAPVWSALRLALSRVLREGSAPGRIAKLPLPQPRQNMLYLRRSAITPIFTPRCITRRRSVNYSVPIIRCCRTTNGCRSVITDALRR